MLFYSQEKLIKLFKKDKPALSLMLEKYMKEEEKILDFYPLNYYPDMVNNSMSLIGNLYYLFGSKEYVFCITTSRVLLLERKLSAFKKLGYVYPIAHSFSPQSIREFKPSIQSNEAYKVRFVAQNKMFEFKEMPKDWFESLSFFLNVICHK